MSVFSISDLHLSFQVEKPMNIFGNKWECYEEKIKENWNSLIKDEDIVLLPGDISWGTYLEQSVEDFKFVDSLNGIKYISKGNHDYWWETLSKLNKFKEKYGFSSINFMKNNMIETERFAISATKGFDFSCDSKIVNRETERIEYALSLCKSVQKRTIIMLHYPPFDKNGCLYPNIKNLFSDYKPDICIYGHLHGQNKLNAVQGEIDGVTYKLVSCDCINFKPIKID